MIKVTNIVTYKKGCFDLHELAPVANTGMHTGCFGIYRIKLLYTAGVKNTL